MLESVYISIVAYVFVNILSQPEMIFYKYSEMLDKMPKWLGKPLGLCDYCLSGQLALWYFIYNNMYNYNVAKHVIFISLTIFVLHIIKKLLK